MGHTKNLNFWNSILVTQRRMNIRVTRSSFAVSIFAVLVVCAIVLHYNRELPNHVSTSNEGDFITDCITKKVIGTISIHPDVVPFTDQLNGSKETAEHRAASFHKVFKERVWTGNDVDPNFVSGIGSRLSYVQEAMAGLHTIISDLKQKFGLSRIRMLDIPCGDMTWMSRFLKTRDDIDYTGYDIVPDLIARHQNKFKNHPWKFFHRDIVENPINDTFDLIFCRVMLQHLVNQDVLKILKRFSESRSKFLLTTTFPKADKNIDLNTGKRERFRFLNLEIPPISLTPPMCTFRDGEGGTSDGDTHFLALWKLPLYMVRHCTTNTVFKITGKGFKVHSCANWTLQN